jgi:hypothetical protein
MTTGTFIGSNLPARRRTLPRLRVARAEEPSGGAIVRQKRQTDSCCCSLWYGLTTSTPVKVRGRVTGIGRVDFNAGVSKFGGELNSQHIQCGLRSAIADEPEAGEFRSGVADLREGTEGAG